MRGEGLRPALAHTHSHPPPPPPHPHSLSLSLSSNPARSHWGDLLSLVTIGATIFATGPTLGGGYHPAVQALALAAYACGLVGFGGMGQVPFLKNSLNSASSWDPPAVYVYAPAITVVGTLILYSLARARSWYELATSGVAILAIAGVYGSAVVTGLALGVPFERLRFQPHHYVSEKAGAGGPGRGGARRWCRKVWGAGCSSRAAHLLYVALPSLLPRPTRGPQQLSWCLCLFFRHPHDVVGLLVRWVFLGIMCVPWGRRRRRGGEWRERSRHGSAPSSTRPPDGPSLPRRSLPRRSPSPPPARPPTRPPVPPPPLAGRKA